jgi:hypothetical protein
MRRIRPALVSEHPNLLFWLLFFSLSVLLFLPLYLLNIETSTLLPPWPSFAKGWWAALQSLVIWRENLDPFRLSLEWTLLIALWSNLRRLHHPFLQWAIIAFYLLALVYETYEAIMVSIYHVDPIFYSQYFLARDGLPFLARNLQTSGWFYLALVGGLAVVGLILVTLISLLLSSAAQPKFHRVAPLSMALLTGLALFVAVRYQHNTARPEMVVSSLAFKIQQNIAASRQLYHDIVNFDDGAVRMAYNYADYQLPHKPDIYLIFVESYGGVLYKRPDYRWAYTNLLNRLEAQLEQAGWQSASTLSDSPTWGGGSWMAYTSLLFGLRIDNHPQYLSLLNKYQVQHYPHLGRYLQSQGYYFAWVSSIADELDDQTWNKYIRFLGVDQWLRYRDLDYGGARYGWGPAPPDQYTLNFANELLQRQTDKPILYVTLTQNSHYPWTPQPELVDDWRSLNQPANDPKATPPDEIEHVDKRRNYLNAITYQLQMLTDFVVQNGNQDSLYILVGDHQPPQVSRRADGWATPMHILSRDPALIEAFVGYGFTPGLKTATLEPTLSHEGFYSLLMRILVANDGDEHLALPAYLPHGVLSLSAAQRAAN